MDKQAFNAMITAYAKHFNVSSFEILAGQSFELTKPQAALLGKNIQQSSDFLKQINFVQVNAVKGKKLLGATEKGITGRKKDGRYLATLDHTESGFELFETDSGVIIPWAMFDNFAIYRDRLGQLYEEYVNTQIALDILQIGWNGTSVADNTSKPDLSDVNKGWLQLLKEQKKTNYWDDEETFKNMFADEGKIHTLDELAFELKQGLDLRHQYRNDLVFLVGADLVAKAKAKILSGNSEKPSEKAALNTHNIFGSFGGMQAITPPNFPARGAVVTTLKNLSLYTESGSQRRSIREDQDRKGIVNSYYRMEGYVVEDVGLMTAIDHTKVKFKDDKEEIA